MDPMVASIVKGLALTENGGSIDLNNPQAGKTGETKSVFQFTPETWKNYAQQTSGNPDLPMTAQNESMVTYKKVSDWLKKGYDVKQIASMWNAGVGEPDAYSGKFSDGTSSIGVNKKYGVKYDVPGYASKVEKYTMQSMDELHSHHVGSKNPSNIPSISPAVPSQNPSKGTQGMLAAKMKKPALVGEGGLLKGPKTASASTKPGLLKK